MNPLYKSFKQNQSGNFQENLQVSLRNLAQQIMPTGMTPEQIVRQKIQNGEMTQAQFEQYGQMASQVMSSFPNLFSGGNR